MRDGRSGRGPWFPDVASAVTMASPQVCANALVRGVGGGNAPPMASESKVASATREMAAPASRVFELIADPSRQPEWDGRSEEHKSELQSLMRSSYSDFCCK